MIIDILRIIESYLIQIPINWKHSAKYGKLKHIQWYYENRSCENYKRINMKRPIQEHLDLTCYCAYKYKYMDIINYIYNIKLLS
jgi:hypothetical protein